VCVSNILQIACLAVQPQTINLTDQKPLRTGVVRESSSSLSIMKHHRLPHEQHPVLLTLPIVIALTSSKFGVAEEALVHAVQGTRPRTSEAVDHQARVQRRQREVQSGFRFRGIIQRPRLGPAPFR